MTTTVLNNIINYIHEDDIITHIEDTPQLFWVFRHGQHIQLSWNELAETEQQYQREAAARAAYVEQFEIY
jgi:type IV secretory pathway ATPase VirB11/archaellum biosynthesis ATPase